MLNIRGWSLQGLMVLGMGLLAACGGGGGSEAVAPVQATAPVLASQPSDAQVVAGSEARFQASVQGSAVTWTWQRSNDNGTTWVAVVNGVTNSADSSSTALVVSAVTAADNSARFRAVASSAGLQTLSSAATLTVTVLVSPPLISVQLAPQQVLAGGTATLAITATGANLQYQWQSSRDGSTWSDVPAATSATLVLSALGIEAHATQYRVIVRNSAGSVTSNAVTLSVTLPAAAPAFTQQPLPVAVIAPAAPSFTVAVTGQPAPTLQWQRSSNAGASYADIAGATAASYTAPATTLADNGALFRAVATSSAGTATSQAAALTVSAALAAPSISTQPLDVTVAAGQTATFTVAASGVPTPGYQWQLSTDAGLSFANINGATSSSYSLVVVVADDGRRYRVVVSNTQGTSHSRVATLTVPAPSSLANRGWVAGTAITPVGQLMVQTTSLIDSSGSLMTVYRDFSGAVWAARTSLGAAGTTPRTTAPARVDAQMPMAPGVFSLSISPAGNAVVGWPVRAACTSTTYATSGTCNYWYTARFLATTNTWEAPVQVGDMPSPAFQASINDAGDVLINGWAGVRDTAGDLETTPAMYWRANGQAGYTRRIFTLAADGFLPLEHTLSAGGQFVIGGRSLMPDAVVYRGTMATGIGEREVLDLRGAAVADVRLWGNSAGQAVVLWHQDNGVRATTYAATLEAAGGTWSVADIGLIPQTTNTFAALSDQGRFTWYSLATCQTLQRTATGWGTVVSLPSPVCGANTMLSVARNGNLLGMQNQNTGTSSGRWFSYDAALGVLIQSPTTASAGAGYLLGFPAALGGELMLSDSGVGALAGYYPYSVLPTPALPNGDAGLAIWGLFLK